MSDLFKFKKDEAGNYVAVGIKKVNIHSSLLPNGRRNFYEVYIREVARFDCATMKCQLSTDNGFTNEKNQKFYVLMKHFGFTEQELLSPTDWITNCHPSIIPMVIAGLFAVGSVYDGLKKEEDGSYSMKKAQRPLWDTDELYIATKKAVRLIEAGDTSAREAAKDVVPLFKKACGILDRDAVDNYTKKWKEDGNAKNVIPFLTSLTHHYTKSNTLHLKMVKNPLDNKFAFENYFLLWILSEGEVIKKQLKEKASAPIASNLIAEAQKKAEKQEKAKLEAQKKAGEKASKETK